MPTKVNTKILNLFCILPIVIVIIVFYWDGMKIFFPNFILNGPHGDRAITIQITKYALFDSLHYFFGFNPLPYHVVTLFIHLTNSILVFFIAKKLADNRLVGFITAILFSAYWADPEALIRVEYMHEELLASFVLSTLVFFYIYRQNPTKLNYSLVLLSALLAFGTKESATFVLVPYIYLTDRYIRLESPGSRKFSKAPYVPLILLSLGLIAYLRFGPVYNVRLQGFVHYDWALSSFVRWMSYNFSFPIFSDAPRWGNVNLILLALFYIFFFPMQIRERVSLLMAAAALLAIPTAPLGSPGLRWLYLSSFFSMTIFGLVLYHGTDKFIRAIYSKESFSRVLTIALCFVFVYFNYLYVSKLIKYYNRASSISENVIKMVSSSLPDGTLNTHVIFINFPCELREPGYPENHVGVKRSLLVAHYGQDKVGQVSFLNIAEIYDGKYTLVGEKKISPLEFENLTKEKSSRVYFFRSKDDSIHDVTGKDFLYIKKLIGQVN